MSASINLITAQISLLKPQLALIHIPIKYYSFFIQPVLRLLFGDDHDEDAAKIPWTDRHDFLNISITPIECSVICSRELADRFFRPLADLFNTLGNNGSKTKKGKDQIEISNDDYIVVQVEGQSLDAGQRVLELTSPLAMAGISIFFITTYFSDYILVPSRSRHTVTKALEQRGFVFSQSADAFVSQLSPSSPKLSSHPQHMSPSSSFDLPAPPQTPPAKDISELQTRTFTRLKRNNINPTVDPTLRLLICAGSKEIDPSREKQLKDNLLQVLLSTYPAASTRTPSSSASPPHDDVPNFSTRFLSLTLTTNEPISVLLEAASLPHLGSSLLGAKDDEDILIPITLDLRDLPMEATGIVCGVAGRLAQGTIAKPATDVAKAGGEGLSPGAKAATTAAARNAENAGEQGAIEISFLSTARAGTVIVKASELDRAVKALAEAAEVVEIGGGRG